MASCYPMKRSATASSHGGNSLDQEAVQWLEEIFEYIAADNPHAATAVVSGIFDRAQILSEFPQIGYLYRKEQEGEIRVLLHGHYRIGRGCGSDCYAES